MINLFEIANKLTDEKHTVSTNTASVVATYYAAYANLGEIETASYEFDSPYITPELPEITVAYGEQGRVLKVFAVQQKIKSNEVSFIDSDGCSFALSGGVDSEQFLYLCNRLFSKDEVVNISVFRHPSNFNLPKMWQPDSLFIKAALTAYNITADESETDRLVVSVLQAFDSRPTGYSSGGSCQRTGWCLRWSFGDRCIKGLGMCLGIPR